MLEGMIYPHREKMRFSTKDTRDGRSTPSCACRGGKLVCTWYVDVHARAPERR
ncbi:unnamed protein product [Periconia digitata]|uniref:Uncharacterized protein n=1 Tax=Periconia digitata TaxID=1303443 RepID=A0A9W4XR10_9PLEO|nr:unnamed protein product [Periconia digitata]